MSLHFPSHPLQNINERRRRFEDNLAAIFMGFVLVFLVCHFPRLLLNIHELITLRDRATRYNLRPNLGTLGPILYYKPPLLNGVV